jgi:hypothetical protein
VTPIPPVAGIVAGRFRQDVLPDACWIFGAPVVETWGIVDVLSQMKQLGAIPA